MSKSVARDSIVGKVGPVTPTDDGENAELAAMKAAIKALRPGEDIHLHPEVPPIHLDEIRVEHIMKFSQAIANALPQIQRNLNLAKLSTADFRNNGVQVIAAVLPVVATEFGELIDECVTPRCFKILPPDLAAPIISRWIEVNILDSGKLEAWKKAFGPILERLKSMVTDVQAPVETETDLTSETSAKS